MEPRIEVIPAKKLVGVGATMSLAEDSTPRLWRSLMPRRGEIADRATSSYISMRVYGKPGMAVEEMFAPDTVFEKWAAVEVSSYDSVPEGLARHALTGGMYAVFVHEGPASSFPLTMRRIFGDWLPASDYELDDREHFEVVPEGWKADDPGAREEIWVPVRPATRLCL